MSTDFSNALMQHRLLKNVLKLSTNSFLSTKISAIEDDKIARRGGEESKYRHFARIFSVLRLSKDHNVSKALDDNDECIIVEWKNGRTQVVEVEMG